MIPAALFAMLAIARLGAIRAVVFGGFSPPSLAQRMEASRPKAIMTASCGIEGNKGSMATVGKRKAVVDLPGFSFQGVFAWLTWMFVHLMLLLNVKNRIIVFLNWMMSYFANDSTLRLMLKASRVDSTFEKTDEPVAKGS